jgi:tetratricopeptide (TPR) repeat protein
MIRGLADLQEDPQAYYRAGITHGRSGEYELALANFQKAVNLRPDFALAHAGLGRAFLYMGNVVAALLHAQQAAQLEPTNPDLAAILAEFLEANRESDRAWQTIRPFIEQQSRSRRLALIYAMLAPRLHRQADALRLIDAVLASGTVTAAAELTSLHFAAANLLDNVHRFDEAFERATIANSLRGVTYHPQDVERQVNERINYFTRPTLRRLPRATHGSELPVFIVGMPRSGTTLIEQILCTHPAIHGAGELNWLFALCELAALRHPTHTGNFSDCVDAMSATDADELSAQYLQPLQALNPMASRIINKMPGNFVHLGLIQLLFPMARVVHCRRDPLDTCLSCYMTDFAAGQDFSFSLSSLGHFYRQYLRMMEHWRDVLDLPILQVQYEALIDDLEGQARRMLEFLGLPWNENCLRFHENRRFIATASNQQVRNPIYQRSIGRWRNYEKHLGPLREALGV